MYSALAEVLPPEQLASQQAAGNEERLPSWAEEVLTPEQFFTPAADSAMAWTGERRLLFAVLQDAVDEFLRYRNARSVRGKRLFREAQEWFESEDRSWLCSFESICAHLNLDPDYIRLGLKRWQKATESPAAAVSPPRRKSGHTVRHLSAVRVGEKGGYQSDPQKRTQGGEEAFLD